MAWAVLGILQTSTLDQAPTAGVVKALSELERHGFVKGTTITAEGFLGGGAVTPEGQAAYRRRHGRG